MHLLVRATGSVVTIGVLVVLGPGVAEAAPNPNGTGQPSQTCGSDTAATTPGRSMTAPGSAFNPNGQSGSVYAGEQPQNSGNPASVSQYDVACFQVSHGH